MNEQHPINKAIWNVIDDHIEMYRDNSKPLITFDYNFAGTVLPITLTDEFLIKKTLELSEEKANIRVEYLSEILKGLPEGERIRLAEICIDSFEYKEYGIVKKSKFNKMVKNLKKLLSYEPKKEEIKQPHKTNKFTFGLSRFTGQRN